MTRARRQIVFINTSHTITHYSLVILPTAVLAMTVPGGPFGESYGPILALATGMFVLYGLLSLLLMPQSGRRWRLRMRSAERPGGTHSMKGAPAIDGQGDPGHE
jgi:hypothetical protein